jgi:hypothetical protein
MTPQVLTDLKNQNVYLAYTNFDLTLFPKQLSCFLSAQNYSAFSRLTNYSKINLFLVIPLKHPELVPLVFYLLSDQLCPFF